MTATAKFLVTLSVRSQVDDGFIAWLTLRLSESADQQNLQMPLIKLIRRCCMIRWICDLTVTLVSSRHFAKNLSKDQNYLAYFSFLRECRPNVAHICDANFYFDNELYILTAFCTSRIRGLYMLLENYWCTLLTGGESHHGGVVVVSSGPAVVASL
jgi:hypothetical protein